MIVAAIAISVDLPYRATEKVDESVRNKRMTQERKCMTAIIINIKHAPESKHQIWKPPSWPSTVAATDLQLSLIHCRPNAIRAVSLQLQ